MTRLEEHLMLIAHRGGVVEKRNPENSPGALDEAVARGYGGVEIDLRSTADGAVVCYHDATVADGFLRRRRVRDLTLTELRGRVGSWVLTMDEMLARCAGRVRVMIDVKEETTSPEFHAAVAASLHASGLLESSWVIGSRHARDALAGRARTAVSVGAVRRGERSLDALRDDEFLFGHGTELDDRLVGTALECGVELVPSINRFHYLPLIDPLPPAGEDVARLLALGVTTFQIDSEFDRFFPGHQR